MKPADFRLTAIINAVLAESWQRIQSDERREHDRLCKLAGVELDHMGAARIPGHALRAADLSMAGSGSYLAGNTVNSEYVAAPTEESLVERLGARIVQVPLQTAVFARPAGSAGITPYWLSSETAQVPESPPTIGSAVAAPKLAAGYCEISRLLLLQAPNAEDVVREELRLARSRALDAAALSGEGGSGVPQGIIGTPGVGAFTGTSLDQAALRDAQADLGAAKAITNPSKVAMVANSAVALLLSKRQRFSGSDRTLWEGSSFDGISEGIRAVSTEACPAATAIVGDWSSLWIAEFAGGMQLEIDPFTNFQAGMVGLRLLVPVDVLVARPAAFSVASSIT